MADKDKKRFYWLKLQKDFFKRHDIRIIETMPSGKDYILFYLKLLCESTSHEGNLRFSDTIPYSEEMLGTITNTDVQIVRNAINVFSSLNMIEILDDGTYFMNEVTKMIGSESGMANRMRTYRKKEKELQLGYNEVTLGLHCNLEKEIEKEIEKELDNNNEEEGENPDFVNLFHEFEEELKRPLSQKESEFLLMLTNNYSHDLISLALKEAVLNNARSFRYVETILMKWNSAGITTVDEAMAQIDSFNKMKTKQNQPIKKEIVPEWFQNKSESESDHVEDKEALLLKIKKKRNK